MSLHNNYFYHNTIRKYVVSFGNIFNSIYIVRSSNGNEDFREKVPMAYGPKEKYVYRLEQNPDLNERFAIKLPRISFELLEMIYDANRKTPSNIKLRNPTQNPDSREWSYNAVPYNFLFEVNIMGKTSDECLQIVEQIAPFFTPDHTLTIDSLPELNHKLDIPIVLNSINKNDNWDGTFDERRNIIWTMEFTLMGFLYPPVRDSKIITQAEWNIYDGYSEQLLSSGIETEQ